jgi:hypothetical protein
MAAAMHRETKKMSVLLFGLLADGYKRIIMMQVMCLAVTLASDFMCRTLFTVVFWGWSFI